MSQEPSTNPDDSIPLDTRWIDKPYERTTELVPKPNTAFTSVTKQYWQLFLWWHITIRGKIPRKRYLWAIAQMRYDEDEYFLDPSYRKVLEETFQDIAMHDDFLPDYQKR